MRSIIGALALSLTTAMFAATHVALPTLTAEDDEGGSVSLPIEALQVDVLIRGHLARTTYEITFRNDLDRDLDGQFSFPLPPNAEVSELGLYFDGRLRRAVAVERVQARTAYEEIVHRRVDPALAEWSASTRAFRFRVYPIPAKNTKVVHIAYDQDLLSTPYELDLRHDTSPGSFDLSVDTDGSVSSEGLALRRFGKLWIASQKQARLNIVVRATGDDFDGALAAWSPSEKSWYFSTTTRIRSNAQPVTAAPHVTLLYDVSSSAVQRDETTLQAFLKRFIEHTPVTVVPFHVRVDSAFDADPFALERLGKLRRAGATNLIALLEELPEILRRVPPQSRVVLVTDGIQTIGDSARLGRAIEVAASAGRKLTVINASPSADDNILARIASATGGWHIDLTRTTIDDAIAAAMRVPMRSALRPAAPGIREVLPATLTITTDTTALIHARSQHRMLAVPLILGDIRRDLDIRELVTDEERDLVRRAWARARLRTLLERGASADEVRAHGLRFRQITPHTSLLVLETWQDYEMYGIPMSLELRALRDAEIAQAEAERRQPEERGSIRIRGFDEAPSGAWLLRGKVTDGEYALPGVTISLQPDEGPTLFVVSDGDGVFQIRSPRRPERFTLRAELPGFLPVAQAFPRGAASGAVVEIVLRMGIIAESITVTAESPILTADETQMAGPPRGIGGSKALRVEAALASRDVRALTDLAEGYPDDAPILRIVGRVLEGWGEGDLARLMFERALELAPNETQTSRELLLLDGNPRNDPSAELQVEVLWDTNYTDVDLRIVEPSGEGVSYQHMHSKSGGTLHEDVTDGYGPETYTLPRMEAGAYQIVLDYYNEDDTSVSLQTLVHVIVYVRGERRDYVVVLTGEKERVVVTTVTK